MFFVSELGNVTTLSEAQTLRAYQFVKYEEGTKTWLICNIQSSQNEAQDE